MHASYSTIATHPDIDFLGPVALTPDSTVQLTIPARLPTVAKLGDMQTDDRKRRRAPQATDLPSGPG